MKKAKQTTKARSAPKKETASPSKLIDAKIKSLGDWRGETLAKVRALIHAQKLPAEKVGTVWVIKVGDPAPEPAPLEEKFLSIRETADCLNIPPAKARQLIYSGKLPATKVGRNWVVKQSDIPGCLVVSSS